MQGRRQRSRPALTGVPRMFRSDGPADGTGRDALGIVSNWSHRHGSSGLAGGSFFVFHKVASDAFRPEMSTKGDAGNDCFSNAFLASMAASKRRYELYFSIKSSPESRHAGFWRKTLEEGTSTGCKRSLQCHVLAAT